MNPRDYSEPNSVTDWSDSVLGTYAYWPEGRHPIQLQADEDLKLPKWWPFGGLAVLLAVWVISFFWPMGWA